jgi:hypothetical protein
MRFALLLASAFAQRRSVSSTPKCRWYLSSKDGMFFDASSVSWPVLMPGFLACHATLLLYGCLSLRKFSLIAAAYLFTTGLCGARMLTSPPVTEATPPYASCACANDILSNPRPIRTAMVSAKERFIFSVPRGRFDPMGSLYEALESAITHYGGMLRYGGVLR